MTPYQLGRIAHPTDLSTEGEIAYHHALRLAVATGANLDMVHVNRDAHVVTPELFPSPATTLDAWRMEAPEGPAKVQRIAAYGKEPVQPIVGYLSDYLPDLLVLATHRRQGLARWLRREVAQKIARNRRMPTLYVPVGDEGFVSPTTGHVNLHRVLVPVDWTPIGQPAVDTVLGWAESLDAWPLELSLFHVAEKQGEFPTVVTPEREGLDVLRMQRNGKVEDEIVRRADEIGADLVVMVTDGRHGFLDGLRGSTTEQVLRQLHCPLLVIPNPIPGGVQPEL